MTRHIILGVHITNRMKNILDVQKIFTEYGSHIKTRLGLHELDDKEVGAPKGLIILEMVCNDGSCDEMMKKLQALEGVECQRMVFEHPEGYSRKLGREALLDSQSVLL